LQGVLKGGRSFAQALHKIRPLHVRVA